MEDSPPKSFLRTPEGRVYGPVDREILESWLCDGRIDAQCELRQEDGVVWEKASVRYPVLLLPEGAAAGNPFHAAITPPNTAKYLAPHHAGIGLALSLMGLVGLCPIFSIAGWVISHNDLQQVETGTMDPSGRVKLTWAYYLGMTTCLIWSLACGATLLAALLQIVI